MSDPRTMLASAQQTIGEMEAQNTRFQNALETIADEYPHTTWVGSVVREALENTPMTLDEHTRMAFGQESSDE